MPPRKSTKIEEDKKVQSEIKEEKKTRVSKAKQNNDVKVVEPVKEEVKEVKKVKAEKVKDTQWAEVTDDGDYQNNDEQQKLFSEEDSSEKSSEESEKELLIEAIKTVADKINKTKTTKSVTDFDYEELFQIDQEELVDYDTNTLLKVLMVRGTKTNNPILWGKCKTLLQILNFELKPNQPHQQRHYNNNKYNAKKPEQPNNDNKKVDEKPDTNEQNTESKKVFSNWRKGKGGKKE
jgi:hypothetical protein